MTMKGTPSCPRASRNPSRQSWTFCVPRAKFERERRNEIVSARPRRYGQMDIRDANALVTEGASGLGAATVRALCGAGAFVVIADVNRRVGEDLAQQLGGVAAFAEADVA